MAKITKSNRGKDGRETITVRTQVKPPPMGTRKWWKAPTGAERGQQLIETASFLKEQLQYRYRQASLHSKLYSNVPLFGIAGTSLNKMAGGGPTAVPMDRPTMNVIQSCVDTLVSRITQSKPRPMFLTDNGNWRERNLAKKLNSFIMGEFHRCKAYELGETMLRDASVLGPGLLKVFEGDDNKVCIERVLYTELLVDPNDGLYGNPRQIYQLKLVDRDVFADMFPEYRKEIMEADQAFPDNAGDSSKTVSDQIMVIEGWRLPSSKDAKDGRHMIACTSCAPVDEEYTKSTFPFVIMNFSPRLLGYFGQGLAEQLMGTQIEINKLLSTITKSINLVGVPRVFVEDGSKVVKSHLNNDIGSIVTYRGTKPIYEVAPCVAPEIYQQLQRLVEYAYQQSGISSLSAASQKPAGLDSGAALREYDDLQTDRFAAISKRYDNFFIELAYKVIDLAKDIAERDGKYTTVYPGKNEAHEVDLPKASLLDDNYIIQCYDVSSLPRDPAGRLQKVTEMIQAGMISIQEGRRLLDYPDLEQQEKLANAPEERILQVLDRMVEDGKYTPPDPFMDLALAIKISNQYYNLYVEAHLSEERAEMLRQFNTQSIALQQQAMAAMAPPQQQQPVPQAPAQPAAASPMVSRAVGQ